MNFRMGIVRSYKYLATQQINREDEELLLCFMHELDSMSVLRWTRTHSNDVEIGFKYIVTTAFHLFIFWFTFLLSPNSSTNHSNE